MLFRALKPTFINDRLYETGQEFDYPVEKLAKNPDGTVNMKKHTSLEPLEELPAAPVQLKKPEPLAPSTGPVGEDREKLVIGAVSGLLPENDAHWTQGGKPSLDALKETLGFAVTRAEVDKLCPDVTRRVQ